MKSTRVNGVLLKGKTQVYEMMFAHEAIDIVGIQEGRAREPSNVKGLYYQMVSAAADKSGNYGCQIWTSHKIKFKLQEIVKSTPRLLCIAGTCCKSQGKTYLFSGHAPCLNAGASDKDSFWDDLEATVTAIRNKTPCADIFLCIDSNGRHCGSDDDHFGCEDPESPNDNGERLVGLLQRNGLAAYNSFFKAGYTWRSTYNTTSRIDYVCGPVRLKSQVYDCRCPESVDLAAGGVEDHKLVLAELVAQPPAVTSPTRKSAQFKVNKITLRDPWCCDCFQRLMWTFTIQDGASVDQHALELANHIKWAACKAFGKASDVPMKPWISSATWQIIRMIAPLRRQSYGFAVVARNLYLRYVFKVWCGARSQPWVDGVQSSPFGWHATCLLPGIRVELKLARRVNAVTWCACSRLQAAARPMVNNDRFAFLENRAAEAQKAAWANDSRSTYAIVRQLAGARTAPSNMPVLTKQGVSTANEEERQLRWIEHFKEVFNGRLVNQSEMTNPDVEPPVATSPLDTSPTASLKAIRKLGRNKGTGKDDIPAELLQVGSDAAAVKISELYSKIAAQEKWPLSWAGGRMVNVHKRKGPVEECDSHRGILLADHLGKGMCTLLAPEIDTAYCKGIPQDQYGAAKERSTDFATHVLLSFIAVCNACAMSYFVLFVDLVKAFDRIVRELVFGWPAYASDPREYLRGIGLNPEQVEWIAEYVAKHGSVLEQWGVDKKVIQLLKNLHACSWFTFGDVDTAVEIRVGGRQGCKFGATVFNCAYTIGLNMLRDELLAAGVAMHFRNSKDDLFWSSSSGDDDTSECVVDVTFVDDECIMIAAKSPALLDKAIDATVKALTKVYSLLRLDINWAPGKTECFLVYRGKRQVKRLDARRVGPNMSLVVKVPGCNDVINVVEKYKHLGTVVAANGALHHNVCERSKTANSAYFPIAGKIFSSHVISQSLKTTFLWSLVLSRLLFNVHILVPTPKLLASLNQVYMRVVRRIMNMSRYSAGCESDLAVRRVANAPSIDCIISKARLRYLARVLKAPASTLRAILGFQRNGQHLPWTQLIVKDMQLVRRRTSLGSSLPCPLSHPEVWANTIRDNGEGWKVAVASIHFTESAGDTCDAAVSRNPDDHIVVVKRRLRKKTFVPTTAALGIECMPMNPVLAARGQYRCNDCNTIFLTNRSLQCHRRFKHGSRIEHRYFAEANGICQVCMNHYQSRLRLIRHLKDRRGRCWDQIASNASSFTRLSDVRVHELDEVDRAARKEARVQGHTTVLSVGSAKRPDGTRIGCVKR